jgi:hypothetical protein
VVAAVVLIIDGVKALRKPREQKAAKPA